MDEKIRNRGSVCPMRTRYAQQQNNGLRMGKNNTGFKKHSVFIECNDGSCFKNLKLSLKQTVFKTIKKW